MEDGNSLSILIDRRVAKRPAMITSACQVFFVLELLNDSPKRPRVAKENAFLYWHSVASQYNTCQSALGPSRPHSTPRRTLSHATASRARVYQCTDLTLQFSCHYGRRATRPTQTTTTTMTAATTTTTTASAHDDATHRRRQHWHRPGRTGAERNHTRLHRRDAAGGSTAMCRRHTGGARTRGLQPLDGAQREPGQVGGRRTRRSTGVGRTSN